MQCDGKWRVETALKCTQAITTCDASFHRTVVNISRLGILAVNNNCDIDRPGERRDKGSFGTRAGVAGRVEVWVWVLAVS